MKRQIARLLGLSTLAVVLGVSIGTMFDQSGRADSSSDRTEFTAVKHTLWFLPSGVESISEVLTEGFRKDGSRGSFGERHFNPVKGRKADRREYQSTWNVAQGLMFTSHPSSKTVISGPLSEKEITGLRRVPDCTAERGNRIVDLNPEPPTLLGFEVIKHTTESTGQLEVEDQTYDLKVVETWLAPSLDCYALRKRVKRVNSETGAEVVTVSEDAISVAPGTPDHILFQVPDGYTERSPMEYVLEEARLSGEPCPECVISSTQGAEERYRARRSGSNPR